LLNDGAEPCMAHAINLCEVYYKFKRFTDEDEARSAIQDLKAKGLVVREDLDEAFWLDAGRHKAAIWSVPLADCFVVALANRLDAEAVTADHSDFDPISEQGICRVTFIR
jgi:predicted nucleic acid-binding protein